MPRWKRSQLCSRRSAPLRTHADSLLGDQSSGSHGNHLSNKFSNLTTINKNNIDLLELAWVHTFEKKGIIPGNPIFFNGTIYLSSTNKSLVALDAISGKKKWEFKTDGVAARRGLLIQGENNNKV